MFIIYSKRDCSYCQAVEKLLRIKELEYEKKVLGREFSREEFIAKFGQTTFPQVVLDGKTIGGAKETAAYIRENLS